MDFAGGHIGADWPNLLASTQAGDLAVFGAPNGHLADILLQAARQTTCPVLFVTTDDVRAAATRDALAFFEQSARVAMFPAWDCPPYSPMSPNPEILSSRMAVLTDLAAGTDAPADIIISTVNAVMQRVPPRRQIIENCLTLALGSRIKFLSLQTFLDKAGYRSTSSVETVGEYAVRGGIVDVFAAGHENPFRLEFFGDQIDGIRSFSKDSQRSFERRDRVRIHMHSEVSLEPRTIEQFRKSFRAEFGVADRADQIYPSISAGIRIRGIENWLPLFHDGLDTIFDYLPDDAILFVDEGFRRHSRRRWEEIVESYNSRTADLTGWPYAGRQPYPCRPELLYPDDSDLGEMFGRFLVRRLHADAASDIDQSPDAGGRAGKTFVVERNRRQESLLDALVAHLDELRRTRRVIVACWSEGSRERLGVMFSDHGLVSTTITGLEDGSAEAGVVQLAVWSLPRGFVSPDLAVVSEQDIFGERLVHRSRKKTSQLNLLGVATSLRVGELVVHVDHGIGRFVGLESVTVGDATHDCLVLEYRRSDRLYIPTVNLDLISRYGEETATLDRLGGVHWQERKLRLRKDLLELAGELLTVAARRKDRQVPPMVSTRDEWDPFVARFQFAETEDQLSAVSDIVDDLATGKLMDRLVCGDVGFGKTEVAMRAAFIVAMTGRQVAVIAPTTLLVRQHMANFLQRFENLPVRIGQLSRMNSPAEAAATRAGIASGQLDIVIGTHALLARNTRFDNLGLVIIDEEHAFGVMQKERLKRVRSQVHVLSLTATPIPRTLHLALSSAKDLSIIGTPPADRLAIRTFVLEFDPITIREALLHEKSRNGQSFLVVPRISDIADFEEFLRTHAPDLSFVSAHGQLPARELERRTNAFYDGRHDLLLSTTIIAAGLDIPSANTIVVVHSNRFGLAQLHQLRGRVGRSRIRAYAYFTYMSPSRLSDNAIKRLEALKGSASLGSGFSLSAQDMEIRGAGNLLGKEQSGHVREVGFELYQKMLNDTVMSLQSTDLENAAIEDDWAPQLNLGVTAMIPPPYIDDLETRLQTYRRLSALATEQELEGMAAEMVDRFGSLPEATDFLLKMLRIKLVCKQAMIERIDAGTRGMTIRFRNNKFANPEALIGYIAERQPGIRVQRQKLVIRRGWLDQESRLKGVFVAVKEIADLVN